MQIKTLLKKASRNIDLFDAQMLLAFILKKPREYFITHETEEVKIIHLLRFFWLAKKRKKNIPLAYLVGEKDFFGLSFFVNKYTLVPRPDTEVLVETVIAQIKNEQEKLLIDIGTGTGCIPISILKTIQKNILCFATDISKDAITIAQKNAARHNVPITFYTGNLLEPLLKNNIISQYNNLPIVLTANLPYLTQEQFDEEVSIQKEPHTALVAAKNGLALYEELLEQIKKLQNKTITCFFEMDPTQTSALTDMIKKSFSSSSPLVHQDYNSVDRFISFEAK